LSPDAQALASCIKPAEARPLYSRAVTIDDLLREVARNHQLERAYHPEQAEAKSKRRDGQFERHQI
jgi:hypothetical protein